MRMVKAAVPMVLACLAVPLGASAAPRITAKAAVIMDARTGAILWERDGDRPLPPASTTKVLAAIIALESGRLDERMRVSPTAAATPASKLYLRTGQRMRLEHLVYAMLLNSANDASVVVAEGLGGSQAAFGRQMTNRARALGARQSSFVNPHGLTAAGHLATANDLATIFRYGLSVPQFREILETQSIRVPVESSRTGGVTLRSHNRLLRGYRYKVIGKTGYTRAAGRCFVGSAQTDSREVIVAFLGSRDLWGDARALFDYALGRSAPEKPVVQMVRRSEPERKPAVVAAAAAPARAARPTRQEVAEGDIEEPAFSLPPEVQQQGGGRFTVCLGPYASSAEVEAARERLAKRGYAPLVSGSSLTLGSFSNRQRASRLASTLRAAGYDPSVVAIQ
ncbi:MAG TPA: D-alanyl-D-alanine carboxypeptidase [Candidatus Limnocylindria bacterium]|nr:D-alanyl-D-alanine carboxypeptidase [Candidatus Limnocylindria bacterium]